jgi:uncharacterized protein YggT (Ycf19 family)
MTDEEKLAVDDANRMARHEAVKDEVRRDVNAEVARHADAIDVRDRDRLAAVGGELKNRAIDEVATTEREITRTRGAARVSQFIDFIFYLIYGIIGLEILLDLLGANRGNAFRQFIATLSAPLVAPFKSLLPDPSSGRFQFRLSYIVALIAYLLLHLVVIGLLRLTVQKKTTV